MWTRPIQSADLTKKEVLFIDCGAAQKTQVLSPC